MRTRYLLAAASAAAAMALAGCADEPRYAGEPGPGFTGSGYHGEVPRYPDARYADNRYYDARYSDEGQVVAIDVVRESGHASGGGAVLGGIAGGVLGHQIGSGRGNTAATVAGAVGGALVGNEVEKRHNGGDYYRVTVRFRDGREATFDEGSIGDLHVGDRVHVDGGRLYRD